MLEELPEIDDEVLLTNEIWLIRFFIRWNHDLIVLFVRVCALKGIP